MGGALKQRGLDRYRQQQYAQALTDLQFARQSSPDDPNVIFAIAGCKLALGSPKSARADYTIVLTGNTQFALAYLGRALAQADLGGVEAARRDFALAQEIDAKAAAGYKETLDARLATAPRPLPPRPAPACSRNSSTRPTRAPA